MDKPAKRLVLCRGQYCNMDRRADKLLKIAEPLVESLNEGVYPPCIRLETANCLSMCGAGPNAILYPDGLIFHHLDEKALRQLFADHLV